ncbi:dynein light chain Tctex-type 5-like [Corticium candelabrum]|uniref:dynein light chain Tctex-type 5-like n=1 Tax=Corticium candelabrum TaxID=121492 RepID=UPI002E252C5F|nr:dynein light chain Tctex-type 5-like [Corticium candelabrum]
MDAGNAKGQATTRKQQRRPLKLTQNVGSSSKRTSITDDIPRRYENTHKMKPLEPFPASQVTQIIQETLEEHLLDRTYEQPFCSQMACTLSLVIRERVKELGQTVDRFNRSLWREESDTYARAIVSNGSLFAVGLVFGVYSD